MPNELHIGIAETILGQGLIDGRPVVILRPVQPGTTSETTPHIFDDAKVYEPLPDDTILWIDGHPDMLIRALMSASIHYLPKDPA